MNKIQITEEQAIEMVRALRYNLDILSESKMVEKWKGAGFIKKTALEEAIQKRKELIKYILNNHPEDTNFIEVSIIELGRAYEAAIKELQDV